ncbi:hypothetical protein B484DRAFT_23827 [Ochromonadaceae sp. CCMP2298]|nr:hypothetical protein B484DRAFT_23827 [Ochromonadaceae sp. CCMP2298]
MTVGVSVASAAYYFITGVDSDTVFNVLMIANISVLALYFFLLGATVGLKEGEQEGLKEGEKEGALGQGATVITLRVAVDSDWTQDNIMQTLSRLRKDPDKKHSKYPSLYALEITQTRATLLADTCVALLRKRSSWSAVSVQGQQKPQAKVQLYFEELAVAEQVRNIPYEQKSGTWYDVRPTREAWSFTREALSRAQFHFKIPVRGSTSTTAVVSMVVAVRGWSKALGGGSEADVAGALQTLAAEARAEGGNIAGLELLWTPSEWGVTLDDRDMLLEYPELMSL